MGKQGQIISNIDVAIIVEKKSDESNLSNLTKLFINAKIYTADEIDIKQPITTALMIIYGNEGFINSPKLQDIIKLDNKIELLFFSTDDISVKSAKTALSHRAYDIYKYEDSDFLKLLKPIIYSIEQQSKLNLSNQYSDMLIKYSSLLTLIHDSKKALFANDSLLKIFNVENIDSATKLLEIKEFSNLLNSKSYTQKIYQIPNLPPKERDYLISHQWITPQKGLFTLLPFKDDSLSCSSYIYSRVEFIELLKNAFIAHKDEDESVYVVLVYIKNAQQIIELSGEETYNLASSALSKLISSNFDASSSIAQWDRDLFVLLLADISPDTIKDQLDKLHEKINIELSTDGGTIYIDSFVIYMNNIDINRAISMVDSISSTTIASKDLENIIYSKMSIEQNSATDREMTLYYLEKILFESPTVKVLNFYKGIRISTGAKLIKLSDDTLYIATEKMQGYVMKLEESVIIQSSSAPYDITARVKVVDIVKKIAILTDFKSIETSANNRQYIRIQSEHRMYANILYSRKTISGIIHDFSIKSIAIKLNHQAKDLNIGDTVDIKFSIPIERLNNELVSMNTKAKIQYIQNSDDETKVILELMMQEPYEGYMVEYIYSKQQALIAEIKAIASRL